VFARYDHVTPSSDLQPDLENRYFNVGAAYKPRMNVDVALVYKQDDVDDGTWTTTNGSIGGAVRGRHEEIGIWTQIQF
jgi:hypothetical protein